jgi:hypothetical protein
MRSPAVLLLLAACATRTPPPPVEAELDTVERALREGRVEQAVEIVTRARMRYPSSVAAAQWSSLVSEMLWRDDDAVREQAAAVRLARAAGYAAPVPETLRGRLGDLLFQAGRWGECIAPLQAGPEGSDAVRRRAFATIAYWLPFVRKPAGPLLTEQPLLPGDSPEFLCGAGDRVRPFAIDTGTVMTTVSRSFAEELDVQGRRPAGTGEDGTGRSIEVEVGVCRRARRRPASPLRGAASPAANRGRSRRRAPRGAGSRSRRSSSSRPTR